MKELLVYWDAGGMNVLVPKKRGEGFLSVPFGHHHNQKLTDIRDKASSASRIIGGSLCELDGLDGYLRFELGGGVTAYIDRRERFQKEITPLLERHYGASSREVGTAEFFGHLA